MADEQKPNQKPPTLEPPRSAGESGTFSVPPKDIEELLKELPKVDPPLMPKPAAPLPRLPAPDSAGIGGQAKPPAPQMPLPKPTPPPASPPKANPPLAGSLQPPAPQSAKSFVRTMAEDLEAAKKGIKPEPKPFEIKPPPALPKMAPLPPPLKMPAGPQIKLGPTEKTKSLELPKTTPPPPVLARKKFGLNPKNLIITLIALAAVFGGAWFFLTREPEVAVLTPSPTPITTPTPTPKTLSQLIPSSSPITISSTQNFLTALTSGVNSLALSAGGLTLLNLIDENSRPYSLNQIFEKLGVSPPNGLLENLDSNEWMITAYGQKESFDSKGLLTFNETAKPKIVLIAKVFDLILLRSALNSWEPALAADLKNLLGLDLKKATSETFLDNIYSGADIRYRNFPFASSTIDYAVVNLAQFNTDYFILAGSRESIYSAIDLLQRQ